MLWFSVKEKKQKNSAHGFGLLEIVVATSVISIVLLAFVNVAQTGFKSISNNVRNLQAQFLAEEALEAVRLLRDGSFSDNIDPLVSGTPYYVVFDGGTNTYSLTATPAPAIDGIFTRTVTLEDVYRRTADDDIIPFLSIDPKVLDTGTRKITARVSWDGGFRSYELATYTADIFNN